jgi:hypothetical protein
MHAASMTGTVLDLVEFLKRQCVHVGAKGNGSSAISHAQRSNHAGACKAASYFHSRVPEKSGDHVRRALFRECQFRMGVQVPPQCDQPWGECVEQALGEHAASHQMSN